MIELDLHEVFGIDIWDRKLMRNRPYVWLRRRIQGLLSTESRLVRVLQRKG